MLSRERNAESSPDGDGRVVVIRSVPGSATSGSVSERWMRSAGGSAGIPRRERAVLGGR